MASEKRMVALVLMLALFGASTGAVHKVGDSSGWTTLGNINYTKWASTQTFHVGDSLLFQYKSQFHNAMQVTHNDFELCNGTSAVATYTSGSDSITLKRPGHFYFLCGVPGHCQAGQKVDVLVKPISSSVGEGPSASPSASIFGSSPANSPSGILAPGSAQSAAKSLMSTKFSLALSLVIIEVFGFAFQAGGSVVLHSIELRLCSCVCLFVLGIITPYYNGVA